MLRNINATSFFLTCINYFRYVMKMTFFIVYSRYCCHAYMPNLQSGFLCIGMLCFTYQIERKSPVSMNGLTGLFFV